MFFLNHRTETRDPKYFRMMYGLQARVLLILLSLHLFIGSLEHLWLAPDAHLYFYLDFFFPRNVIHETLYRYCCKFQWLPCFKEIASFLRSFYLSLAAVCTFAFLPNLLVCSVEKLQMGCFGKMKGKMMWWIHRSIFFLKPMVVALFIIHICFIQIHCTIVSLT